MAPGYAIALVFEAAGLLGLIIGLAVMRAERRTKSDELLSTLRSGRSGSAVAPRHVRRPALRIVSVPAESEPTGDAASGMSAARSALYRVLTPRPAHRPIAARPLPPASSAEDEVETAAA